METIRVLVTGAGSGVGQGIIKALRITCLPVRIISSDIAPLNAGLFRADEALLLPKVESKGSLEIIIKRLRESHVDVVFIGSEFDLSFFSVHKKTIEVETGSFVIVSPLKTVELAGDKWLTTKFLRKNKLPYAETYIPSTLDDATDVAQKWGYPNVLKTRMGTSSRHVHIIENKEQLNYFFSNVPHPMLQQLIDMPNQALRREYTCSIFKCNDGSILGPFTSRRVLRGGSSWIVEVGQFQELHPLLLAIGKALSVVGSLNVQLMIGANGPVPFEFNARFSGTTAIRAYFGFNEPEMALRNYLLKEKLEEPVIKHGLALRYLEEVFVENAIADQAEQYFMKGIVSQWF